MNLAWWLAWTSNPVGFTGRWARWVRFPCTSATSTYGIFCCRFPRQVFRPEKAIDRFLSTFSIWSNVTAWAVSITSSCAISAYRSLAVLRLGPRTFNCVTRKSSPTTTKVNGRDVLLSQFAGTPRYSSGSYEGAPRRLPRTVTPAALRHTKLQQPAEQQVVPDPNRAHWV